MEHSVFEEQNKTLERVKDEKDWDYVGPVTGIRIQPHVNCDPLLLEFDDNYYIQEYCKTQFSPLETHVKIVDFLHVIQPLFEHLIIFDEGEYWETRNIVLLQQHIDNCFIAMDEAKAGNKNLSGPCRLDDGRIVDLMED